MKKRATTAICRIIETGRMLEGCGYIRTKGRRWTARRLAFDEHLNGDQEMDNPRSLELISAEAAGTLVAFLEIGALESRPRLAAGKSLKLE